MVVDADQVEAARLTIGLLDDLGRSLATFQLGESGDGVHPGEAAERAGASEPYRHALAAFVCEEQEHARLLAMVLGAIDYPLRDSHWADRAFVVIRRAKSLRTEVLTLLVAELVALTYYRVLAERFAVFAPIFEAIHADEVRHVDFHAETLPQHLDRWPTPVRAGVRVAWNALVLGAAVVVAVDHRRALRHTSVGPAGFVRSVRGDLRSLDRRLFGSDRAGYSRRDRASV